MIRRRSVSVALALLLGLQWGVAAAHCLRFAPVMPLIELCSPDGMLRFVPLPGEAPPTPAAHAAMSVCAACALPIGAAPPAPLALAAPVTYTAATLARPAPVIPPLRHAARPFQPRAPPAA